MTISIELTLREGRELVDRTLFLKLSARVAAEHGHAAELSERIVDQALAFLATSARAPGLPLSPSPLVDQGWHEFILHTVDYTAFCDKVAGRFLHHVPTDEDDPSASGEPAHEALMRTVDAISAAGFYVDTDLWPASEHSKCSQCHQGCTSSPA
ncbi:glycine-rich domain-containing protein [Antribacter gilvus]|uniref:glycine-rich domain-containing protein n=1 Tax=Antribacter gilvus TaxID=2304675 RepID=UPI000F7B86C0|nr:hypothetical protein [Antribacter gilvus]